MAITPESFNKLTRNSSQASSSGVVNEYDGLTAGDKAFILSSMEAIINNAIGGSQRMGGSNGLMEKLDQKLIQFSDNVKAEVMSMFKKFMGRVSDYNESQEDEPCKIDEKEFKRVNQESLQETFDGGLTEKISSKIHTKQKTFIGKRFISAVFNNKQVQGVLNGIKSTGIFIKESVGGLFTTFFPNFSKYIAESVKFMKATTKFMFGISKFVLKSIAMLGTLLVRTTVMLTLALFRFLFLVGYIATQTVFIIGSIVFQMIAFLTPMAITIGVIALKLLFLVGIVVLALFIIFSFYHFIKTWIDKGFGAAINELFGGETFRKALEGVFATLETLFGMQPGTFAKALQLLSSGELYNKITTWIGEQWEAFKTWTINGTKQLLSDISIAIVTKVSNFWNNTLKPFLQPVIDGVKFLWDVIKSGWNWLKGLPVVGPVFTWLEKTFIKGWNILYGWVEAIYKTTVGAIAETTTAVLDPALAGKMSEAEVVNRNASLTQSTALKKAMEKQMKQRGYPVEQIQRMWRLPWQSQQDIINLSKLNIAIQQSSDLLAFARGGIALGPVLAAIGEAGDNEAVIPLNSEGAQFLADAMANLNVTAPMAPIDAKSADMIKDMVNEEMELGGQQASQVSQIDKKLDTLINLGGSKSRYTGPINVSEDSTSNYIDMIAKGIIE